MPRRAQQRTKNRHAVRVSDPAYIATFAPTSVVPDVGSLLVISYPYPVIVQGIPPIEIGGDLPVAVTQPVTTEVRLEYASQPTPGNLVTIPDLMREVRGRKGEWCQGGQFALGNGAPGTFPQLVLVNSVEDFGGDLYRMITTGPISFAPEVGLLINGLPCTVTSRDDDVSWFLNCPGGGGTGAGWSFPEWTTGGMGADPWIGPGYGTVITVV